MSWEKNLIEYYKIGNAGTCPKCKSENIEVAKHKINERNSITFSCKECGNFAHFDGLKNN